jgi:hypothetical protein
MATTAAVGAPGGGAMFVDVLTYSPSNAQHEGVLYFTRASKKDSPTLENLKRKVTALVRLPDPNQVMLIFNGAIVETDAQLQTLWQGPAAAVVVRPKSASGMACTEKAVDEKAGKALFEEAYEKVFSRPGSRKRPRQEDPAVEDGSLSNEGVTGAQISALNAEEIAKYWTHICDLRREPKKQGQVLPSANTWVWKCLDQSRRQVESILAEKARQEAQRCNKSETEESGTLDVDFEARLGRLVPELLEPESLVEPTNRKILRLCYEALPAPESHTTFFQKLDRLLDTKMLFTLDGALLARCGSKSSENWLPKPRSPTKKVIVLALRGKGEDLVTRCRIGTNALDYYADDTLMTQLNAAYGKKLKEKGGKDYQGVLIMVHGESGSGKTLGMIAIAIQHFDCDVVIHMDLATLEVREPSTMVGKLTKLLLAAGVHSNAEDKGTKVALILDEAGSYPEHLHYLCREHRTIAKDLKDALHVASVTVLCGGTGADAQGTAGSNPKDYLLWQLRPLEQDILLTWLESQNKLTPLHDQCRKIVAWLNAPKKSRLARDCVAMLSNWRAGTYLITELVEKLDLRGDVERHPGQIEKCLQEAMDLYRRAGGLRELSIPDAIATLHFALAFETLALQHDVKGETSFRELFTSLGVLADTWTDKSEPVVGVPRYVMSPALRLIAVQSFGMKGENDPSGAKFEEEMCRYLYYLFQAAFLIPSAASSSTNVSVVLRKDRSQPTTTQTDGRVSVPRHGMQLKYDMNEINSLEDEEKKKFTTFMKNLSSGATLPLKTDATRADPPKSRCLWVSFRTKLQPPVPPKNDDSDDAPAPTDPTKPTAYDGRVQLLKTAAQKRRVSAQLAKKLKDAFPAICELMEECKETDVLIAKNGPEASFADLLIVNKFTKELWLVRCKSFQSEVSLNASVELAKMGHPKYQLPETPGKVAKQPQLYREALMNALGMNKVRYFLCVLVAPGLSDKLASQFPQALPDDVFVLSNAFGFQFTPMDLDCEPELGVRRREWLEGADVTASRNLLDSRFRTSNLSSGDPASVLVVPPGSGSEGNQ